MKTALAAFTLAALTLGVVAGEIDSDGDGVPDTEDCRPLDSLLWSPPNQPVADLALSRSGSDATLVWSTPGEIGGLPGTERYDTLASEDPADFGHPTGFCPELNGTDRSSMDRRLPEPGQASFYLVRIENECGVGPVDTDPLPAVPRAPNYVEVRTTADSGAGSLRAEIDAAVGGEAICFDVTGTIPLGDEYLRVDTPVAIAGPGADQLTIDGGVGLLSVFVVRSDVQISGLSITNGYIGVFSGYPSARTTIRSSTISGNQQGVVALSGTVDIVSSRIVDNSWVGTYVSDYYMNIRSSTISGNPIGVQVGEYGSASITSSTISGNATGVSMDYFTYAYAHSSTISGNDVGVDAFWSWFYPESTILSNTTDCVFSHLWLVSRGRNIVSDTTCPDLTASDQAGVDPLLDPLADNGGPTETMSLLPGSPAIDAGSCPGLLGDQRGLPRSVDQPGVPDLVPGEACDVGAYEVQ